MQSCNAVIVIPVKDFIVMIDEVINYILHYKALVLLSNEWSTHCHFSQNDLHSSVMHVYFSVPVYTASF